MDFTQAGPYVVQLTVTDAASQTATATLAVTVNPTIGTVSALYPANGADWMQYVAKDGTTAFDATDVACNAATSSATGGYGQCLHGGEMRAVTVTGLTACTGVTISDTLGAFDWACSASGGTVKAISTGLTKGMALSDLIDFTTTPSTPAWRSNSVTGSKGAATATTASAVWWTNPITVNNSTGNVTLNTSGTITVMTNGATAYYTLGADRVALVIKPGIISGGLGTNGTMVSANGFNYLWVDGVFDDTGDSLGVGWTTVQFSVLRNVSISNGQSGITLASSPNNLIADVALNNVASTAIYLNTNSGGAVLRDITAKFTGPIQLIAAPNSTLTGLRLAGSYIYLNNSGSSVIADVRMIGPSSTGVDLFTSPLSRLSDILVASGSAAGNIGPAVHLDTGSGNSTVQNITGVNLQGYSVSGGGSGVVIEGPDTRVLNVTSANNANGNLSVTGVRFGGGVLANTVSANNEATGVYVTGSNSTVVNLTTTNNNYGVFAFSTNTRFTGLLKVANNLTDDCLGGVGGGLLAGCINEGASDATLTLGGFTLASSFVGKVGAPGDSVNTSDGATGTATYPTTPATFDWLNFENPYRAWGKDGSAFPAADNQGKWSTGTGRIWDWSLSASDTILRAVLADPSGMSGITHTWSPATLGGCNTIAGASWNGVICTSTFLPNAVEILDDAIGNDNGLCEANEACLYTPNIGSYQGHGNLVSKPYTAAGSGGVAGVTMYAYATNGR